MQTHTRIHILGRAIWRAVPCLASIALFLAWATATAQDHSAQLQSLMTNASSARVQGDIPHAIELYQQALQLDPSWPEGWWYVGSMQYGANNYAPAAIALTHYIDLTPTAGPAFALRGLCEFEEAEYPESLQDLQRGIALGAANQPRNAGIILYHEAILLTKLGNFEQALGKYTQMVAHGDVNQDILAAIGLAGLRLPMLPKDIEPSQIEMLSAVGQAAALFMGHDLPAADNAFLDLFDRYPTVANLHYFYGYLLFSTDSDKAIDQFNKELAVSPDSAITHSMLAWAYGSRSEYKASLADAQQAVKEKPTLLIAQLVLGRALVETGDRTDGVQHLLIVLSADPKNLDAHLALAKAYSELGRKDDARRERLLCLEITGQGAKSHATM
ncbi:MAG: tetratricopeptide repeat protein [Acidobacteriaceae bacterium]